MDAEKEITSPDNKKQLLTQFLEALKEDALLLRYDHESINTLNLDTELSGIPESVMGDIEVYEKSLGLIDSLATEYNLDRNLIIRILFELIHLNLLDPKPIDEFVQRYNEFDTAREEETEAIVASPQKTKMKDEVIISILDDYLSQMSSLRDEYEELLFRSEDVDLYNYMFYNLDSFDLQSFVNTVILNKRKEFELFGTETLDQEGSEDIFGEAFDFKIYFLRMMYLFVIIRR